MEVIQYLYPTSTKALIYEITFPFPNINGLLRWWLGMDTLFHPTLYDGFNYLFTLGLKLIHLNKRGPRTPHLEHIVELTTSRHSCLWSRCLCLLKAWCQRPDTIWWIDVNSFNNVPGEISPNIWLESKSSSIGFAFDFEERYFTSWEKFLCFQMFFFFRFYSERPRGAGFRSVNPAERWRENPARALARAGFSQHLECGIHRSESSPDGSFALIPRPVARWAKTTP